MRKYKEPRRLNRVVLLSDGQANVGPSRPEEFAALGRAAAAQGISVSTIGLGLGYNEDLMLQLARASDGNHAFAREPTDLVQIFNKEFDDVLASCAQTVSIDIELKPGVRVVRALSRDGTIEGQRAQFRMNQVYAATEHYVLMEVEARQVSGWRHRAGAGHRQGRLYRARQRRPQTQDTTVRAPLRRDRGRGEGRLPTTRWPRPSSSRSRASARGGGRAAGSGQDRGGPQAAAAECRRDRRLFGSLVPSQRLRDLEGQYSAMGSALAPASRSQMGLQRKVLRSLENTGAGSATRY